MVQVRNVSMRKVKRKRSKGLVLLLLPALIFVGFIGWLIYSLQPPKRAPKKELKTDRPDGDSVDFLPAVYREQTEMENQ